MYLTQYRLPTTGLYLMKVLFLCILSLFFQPVIHHQHLSFINLFEEWQDIIHQCFLSCRMEPAIKPMLFWAVLCFLQGVKPEHEGWIISLSCLQWFWCVIVHIAKIYLPFIYMTMQVLYLCPASHLYSVSATWAFLQSACIFSLSPYSRLHARNCYFLIEFSMSK